MAFFGLTALGVPRPLAAASSGTVQHLPVFTDQDWAEAWDRARHPSSRRGGHKGRKPRRATDGDDDDSTLSLDKVVPAVLEDVYHGPVPPADAGLLQKWLHRAAAASGEGVTATATIRKSQFLQAMRSAREEAEGLVRASEAKAAPGPACEAVSWREYSVNLRKNKAASRGPAEKYTAPLTAQQEIGWEAATAPAAAAAAGEAMRRKKASEETKFVSEMIKSGMYYYF